MIKKVLEKLTIMTVIAISIFMNGVQFSIQQTSFDNFETYGKSVFGLSIKRPSNWVIVEETRSVHDERVGTDYFVVMCPEASRTSTTPGNCFGNDVFVRITVNYIPANMSLDDFVSAKIGSYKIELTDLKIVSANSTILAGKPAKELVYTSKDSVDPLKPIEFENVKRLQIYTLVDGKVYGAEYQAPLLEFDDNLQIAKKMFDTLSILPMPL